MKKIFAIGIGLAILMSMVIPSNIVKADSGTLYMPVKIRDFLPYNKPNTNTNMDFENYPIGSETGIVKPNLGFDGKPIYALTGTSLTTHGPTYFYQWYNNTPNVNMGMDTTLAFAYDNTKNVYVFDQHPFFPIDGQLLGNDASVSGVPHNFHFTLELHTTFTYQPGMVLNFGSDDDLWVFIGNTLVLDLGGTHGMASPVPANLALINPVPGYCYKLDVFYAERHTTDAGLHLELPPTVLQQPLYVYSAKFLCGTATSDNVGVEQADYSTAINIYNFQDEAVNLRKTAIIAPIEDKLLTTPVRPLTENVTLQSNRAVEIDCADIGRLLAFDYGSFRKGFVVIESPKPLNIEAVYTVKSQGNCSWSNGLEIEHISPVVSPNPNCAPGY